MKIDGFKAAEILEKTIPSLLRHLQSSHDTFEEDWNRLWNQYIELKNELLQMKENYQQNECKNEKESKVSYIVTWETDDGYKIMSHYYHEDCWDDVMDKIKSIKNQNIDHPKYICLYECKEIDFEKDN